MIFFALSHGISVEQIDNKFITIERLYIKLDKKIILNAKNIKLNYTLDSNESMDEKAIQTNILEYMSKFNFINEIFHSINIENFSHNNLNTSISFKNNNFKIENEYAFVDFDAKKDKNIFHIKTNKLFLKQQNITADVILDVNLRLRQYDMSIDLKSDFMELSAKVFRDKDDVDMSVKNLVITDIKKVEKVFLTGVKIPQAVKEWVFYRAVAKKYTLKDARLSFNIYKTFSTKSISLEVLANDVDVKFLDTAKTAYVKLAKVIIKDNNVSITYDSGVYNKTKLSKGGVDIINALSGKNISVVVSLSGDDISLDGDVSEVLSLYKINTGVNVGNAKSKVSLQIKIDTNAHKIDTTLDAKVSSGVLKPLNLNIKNANVNMKNNHLYINADVYDKNISSKVNADFDFSKQSASFVLNSANVNYGKYLKIKNKNINFNMTYNKDIKINIPEFKTNIYIDKALKISVENLSVFTKYSDFLTKLNFDKSSLNLDYQNGVYEVTLDNFALKDGFLYANSKPYQSDKITINYSDDFLNIIDKEKRIFINEGKDHNVFIDVKNIQIKQNKSLDNFLTINEDDKSSKNYKIKADNIMLFIDDLKKDILLKNLSVEKTDITVIKSDLLIPNNNNVLAKLFVKMQDKQIGVSIDKIDSSFLNYIMDKEVFSGGNFILNLQGEDLSHYKARFYMYKTLLKGYKTYQRILTYINAVPNLLVFKSSNLNEKGFVVNHGNVDVIRQDDIYIFTNAELYGSSADIKASGVYDSKYKDIKLIMDLITMKSVSSIISNTPIVSQIILGDKKQFSTRLKVTGDIDNVSVSSELASELATSPFQIIKNVVTLPVNLFK